MNAFDETRKIEAAGMPLVVAWLRQYASDGVVETDKGTLSFELQTTVGDLLFNSKKDGSVIAVEVKIEQASRPNFFIEDWSNLSAATPTLGWIHKIKCDYIAYLFLDKMELYLLNRAALFGWLFVKGSENPKGRFIPNHCSLQRVIQGKYNQQNKTCGMLLPISRIRDYDHNIKPKHAPSIIQKVVTLGGDA